jgi:hypothetical protein
MIGRSLSAFIISECYGSDSKPSHQLEVITVVNQSHVLSNAYDEP